MSKTQKYKQKIMTLNKPNHKPGAVSSGNELTNLRETMKKSELIYKLKSK